MEKRPSSAATATVLLIKMCVTICLGDVSCLGIEVNDLHFLCLGLHALSKNSLSCMVFFAVAPFLHELHEVKMSLSSG